MNARRGPAALPALLLMTVLVGGCSSGASQRDVDPELAGAERPSESPILDAATLVASIASVENGLVPIGEDGEPAWGEKATLAQRMDAYGVPALSIAVIDDFELVWTKGYGVLEAGADEPATARTLFHAGSVAKSLTATAALALVEHGVLTLDEPINDRLVSWRVPENELTARAPVTLRGLLSHSAGLTDGWTDSGVECCFSGAGDAPTTTIQQMLEAEPATGLPRPTRVTSLPGSEHQYANLGYGIVELLMVDVAGKPFPQVMEELLLEPLELGSSTFTQPLPETMRGRAATEHDAESRPFPDERHHFPTLGAGGLWTTAADLARFANEIMLAYSGRTGGVLSPGMAREMLVAQVQIPEHPIQDAAGLGFALSGEGEGFSAFHTGGTWGSTCLVWFMPETGQGVVVMTNSAAGGRRIRFEILLSVAREYGWPE
jgi:CubicO group peptidase (beta-lactamase class C family)